MSLASLHRLSLLLGTSLERARECAAFMDWLQAEVGPRRAALFVAAPGRESLLLAAAIGFRKPLRGALPAGHDPWGWLEAQKMPLPRGERYALPILLEGELFGLLAVVSAQKGEALSEEQRLLDLALAYLAPILRNIEHYENVERTVEERTAQLRESEERFRTLAETTATAIFVYSGEKFIYVNHATELLTGYTAEELLAKRFWDVVHPDFREMIRQRGLARQRGEQVSPHYEFKIVRKDGEERWVDFTAGKIEWQGKPAGLGTAFDITERKQAEEALREQEERFRAYIERASDYIFTLDPQGNFTFANDTMCAALGYREQDLLGKPALMVAAPEARQQAARTLQRIWDGDTVDYIDLPVRTRDGNALLVQIRGRAFYRDGKLIETLHIARDITLQKQAEEALKESEEKFKTLFHSANDAIFLMNHTTFLDCNATTEKIFQCSRDQIIGRSPVDFSPEYQPDGRLSSESAAEKIEAAFAGRPQFFEWMHTHLDGTPFHAEVSLNRVFIGGEFILQAIVRDISERKRAEDALDENRSYLKAVLDSVNDAVFVDDADTGEIIDVNLSMCEMYGYTYEEALRTPIGDLSQGEPPYSQAEAIEWLRKTRELGPQVFEWLAKHKDGHTFWVEVSTRFVVIGGKNRFVVVVRDITARKHHERQLEAQAMLARALGESLELQPLLERLLEAARHAIPAAEKGSVLLLEADGRLRVRALNGYTDPHLKEFAFANDAGYGARAARERRPLLIADVRADPEIRYDGEIEEARQIHGAIAVPLLIQERVIGVLSLDSTQKDAFTPEDLNHLVGFAATAALVIENARLFEVERRQRQMAEQLSHALEAGASLTSLLDSNLVLDRLLESVEQVIPFDGANIMLVSPESGKVRIARLRGYLDWDEQTRQTIQNLSFELSATGNLRWLYEHKQPLVIPDTAQYPGWIPVENVRTRSWVGAPILINNQVAAFFSLDSLTPNFFTEEHALLLQAFAGQASLALQNARLFEQQTRLARRLQTLHLVSQEVIRRARSPEQVYQAVYQAASQLMSVDNFTIALYDEARGEFDGVYLIDEGQRYPPVRASINEGISGFVIRTGKVLRIRDIQKEPAPTPVHYGTEKQSRAYLCVPLRIGEKIIGAMSAQSYQPNAYQMEDEALLEMLASYAAAAIQNASLFEETRHRAEEITSLLDSSIALSSLDLQETLQTIGQRARMLFQADGCRIFLLEPDGKTLRCVLALADSEAVFADLTISLGYGVTGHVAQTGEAEIVNDMLNDPRAQFIPGTEQEPEALMFAPLKSGKQTIGVISIRRVGSERPFQPNDLGLLQAFASLAASAVSNARLFENIQQHLYELEILQSLSAALRQAHTVEEMLPLFIRYAARSVNAAAGSIYLWEEASGEWVSQGWMTVDGRWQTDTANLRHRPGEGVTGWVGERGEIYVTTDWRADPTNQPLPHEMELLQRLSSGISLPLKAEERIIGVMHLWHVERREFSAEDKRLLTAIADMAGNAMQRARLYEETTQQLKRLTALRDIDRAIASSFDLNLVFTFLLNGILTQLNADAADILLFEPHTNTLYQAAKRGFRNPRLANMYLRLDESLAGRAALERTLVAIPNLYDAAEGFSIPAFLEGENFKAYYAYPLVVKGELKGVLEVFHRAPLFVTSNWLDFFETLAGQAAIAIDNARLFESLERSNLELMLAYDETIEGWSRALDLRDRETEGHTRRVTELTLKLAQVMGLSQEQITHIRRGALLHDIGKMGVPDSILLKPAPLTDEEQRIMRQHPQFAYDMLAPIQYLRPALDIPYCHHEKWDGTGYPRGLKGEAIPLAARIFAIADVYDALTSDRPYRPAWTKEKTLAYLRQQSGSHFDPQLVEKFITLVAGEK